LIASILLTATLAGDALAAHFRGTLSVKLNIPANIANQLEVTAGQNADIGDPFAIQSGAGIVIASQKATSAITNPPAGGTLDVTAGRIEGIANGPGSASAASLFVSHSFILTNKSNMELNVTIPYTYSIDLQVDKFITTPAASDAANVRATFGLLDLINGGGIIPEHNEVVIDPRLDPEDPPGVITVFCNNCPGTFTGALAPMGDLAGQDKVELVLVGGVQGNAIYLVPEPASAWLLAMAVLSVAVLVGERTRSS
jgi:hypothetical protein